MDIPLVHGPAHSTSGAILEQVLGSKLAYNQALPSDNILLKHPTSDQV